MTKSWEEDIEPLGVCGKKCDHGSECLGLINHQPANRHETQHGCIFYDTTEENEAIVRFSRSEYERVENQRDALRDEVEQLRKELTDVRKYCDDILSVLAFTVERMTVYRDKVEGKEKEESSNEKE